MADADVGGLLGWLELRDSRVADQALAVLMATLNFAASVDKWAKQSVARMEAVFKTAAEITIEEVSVRTPVDTGFLRASLTVSLSGMLPIRANAKGTKPKGHVRGTTIYEAMPYALVINGAELGDTIYASFVASYAAHVEYGAEGRAGHGMVRLAAQNWKQNVNQAIARVKGQSGG